MTPTTHSELALQRMTDDREVNTRLHEELVKEIEDSPTKVPTEAQEELLRTYREKAETLDRSIGETLTAVEANNRAVEASKKIRRVLAGNTGGVEVDGDTIAYRSMAAYAR